MSATKARDGGIKSLLGLGACALCMAGAAQLIQYSKRASGSYNYSPYTLTTLVEVAKLGISLVGLLVEFRSHGLHQLLRALMNVPHRVKALYAIPAAIYMINNNLYYWILQHLDATTLQVVMSFKIVSTATLMTLVLGKKLNFAQVCALLLLTLATAAVQFDQNNTSSDAYRVSLWGLALAFVYCLLSGLAGVVTEALLKGRHNASLHTSNTFLYSYGVLFNLAAYRGSGNDLSAFFDGVTPIAMVIVVNAAAMGTLIAAVMKYFDNIVKVYLNSLAIIVSVIITTFVTGVAPSSMFVTSIVLVSMSAVAYNRASWGPLDAFCERFRPLLS